MVKNRRLKNESNSIKKPISSSGRTGYAAEEPPSFAREFRFQFSVDLKNDPLWLMPLILPIYIFTIPLGIHEAINAYRKKKRRYISGFAVDNRRLQRIFDWADRNGIPEQRLPRDPVKLVYLEHLSLGGYKLHHLPEEIGLLKGLRSLSLDNNQLKYLPHSLGNLSALEKLSLSGNRIEKLPHSFSRLEHLQSLDFSRNGLKRLPNRLFHLDNLSHLRLTENELSLLPSAIGRLKWTPESRQKSTGFKLDIQRHVQRVGAAPV